MTLVEQISQAISSVTSGFTHRAYRVDPMVRRQIVIVPGGGRVVKGTEGFKLRYTPVQIQVHSPSLQECEAVAYNIIQQLDGSTSVPGVAVIHWDGRAPDYWTSEGGVHCFAVEFIVIF